MTTTLTKPRLTRDQARRQKYGRAFRAGLVKFLTEIGAHGKLRWYEFSLETTVGILELDIFDTWIAGRFIGDNKAAVARLGPDEVGTFSNKWNHLYSLSVPVAQAVENFKRSLARILPAPGEALPPHYFRLKYRKAGTTDGFSILAPGLPALHSLDSLLALLADWNRRDAGKREWAADEVLPEDFDHPSQRKDT